MFFPLSLVFAFTTVAFIDFSLKMTLVIIILHCKHSEAMSHIVQTDKWVILWPYSNSSFGEATQNKAWHQHAFYTCSWFQDNVGKADVTNKLGAARKEVVNFVECHNIAVTLAIKLQLEDWIWDESFTFWQITWAIKLFMLGAILSVSSSFT